MIDNFSILNLISMFSFSTQISHTDSAIPLSKTSVWWHNLWVLMESSTFEFPLSELLQTFWCMLRKLESKVCRASTKTKFKSRKHQFFDAAQQKEEKRKTFQNFYAHKENFSLWQFKESFTPKMTWWKTLASSLKN